MGDTFTEVTRQSWFGRIGEAIKGVLFGLVMVAAAFVLLFWNEGRAVKTARSLSEGKAAVVSVPAEAADPANEGKLVHVTGTATTDETLSDPQLGVSAQAVKLRREAQMYQWQESKESKERKKLGGGTETTTTYSYRKVWDDSRIDSSGFKDPAGHQNPGSLPYSSQEWAAGTVRLGGFTLSPGLVGKIGGWRPLRLQGAPAGLGSALRLVDGGLYQGPDPSSPRIGDTRIAFSVVSPTLVSVVARQTGSGFEPYRTSAGRTLELCSDGSHSAQEMFQSEISANRLLTWAVRLGGWLLMAVGLGLFFRPFVVLADVLPFLGNLLGLGVGLLSALTAFILSLLTVAIAWVVYRPLLGVTLMLLAVLALAAAAVFGKRAHSTRTRGLTVPPPLPTP